MERAVREPQHTAEYREVKIPRPYPGGSYSIESLGRWVDRLLGDERAAKGAQATLESLLMGDEEMPSDPEPVEIPQPIPGADEPVTKGGDPPAERRG